MKSDKEILDLFGEEIVRNVYDDAINYFNNISSGNTSWGIGKEYTDVLNKLNSEDLITIKKYFKETLGTSIFSFLGIFENNDKFQIVYKENKTEVNLNSISEMLKAEATIENGWIDRFSKKLPYNK